MLTLIREGTLKMEATPNTMWTTVHKTRVRSQSHVENYEAMCDMMRDSPNFPFQLAAQPLIIKSSFNSKIIRNFIATPILGKFRNSQYTSPVN